MVKKKKNIYSPELQSHGALSSFPERTPPNDAPAPLLPNATAARALRLATGLTYVLGLADLICTASSPCAHALRLASITPVAVMWSRDGCPRVDQMVTIAAGLVPHVKVLGGFENGSLSILPHVDN